MAVPAVFDITLELINGLKVGIEHMIPDEEEEESEWEQPLWLIIIDLLVIRIGIVKYSNEE